MGSNPKQMDSVPNNNGSLGKRKKSRSGKGSYLSKWLDKTMNNIQEPLPNVEIYDPLIHPNINWHGNSQFAPGYDPYRQFYGCNLESLSLPTPPTYSNPPFMPFLSPEYRYIHHHNVNKGALMQRPRLHYRCNKPEESASMSNSLNKSNYLQPKNHSESQDFASLPPVVTSVTDTYSNSEMNAIEKDDGNNNNRRYSDPCVRGLPDVARPANGEAESDSEGSSALSGSQVGSRLLSCLLDQITALKVTNERLNKELMDTKVDLENLRQHNIILQKGSSSSIGGTPNHAPYVDQGLMGQYGPGFVTDVVREIRDAAKMREEALYARVCNMIMERTENGLSSSETKISEKTLDEIKSSLRASEADKRLMMDRIVKLEEELRQLRLTNGSEGNDKFNGNIEDADVERVRLRKEVADMRKAKQNAEEHAHNEQHGLSRYWDRYKNMVQKKLHKSTKYE